MKYIVLIIALALTGCQSLMMAGSSAYTLRQTTDHGRPGFEMLVKSGKEIAQVKARLEKDGDKIIVYLEESGVAAFAGQQIAADALKVTVEQAVKAAVATALGMASGGALPAIGAALSSGGLPAAAVGAGGALLLDRTLSRPNAPAAPAEPSP